MTADMVRRLFTYSNGKLFWKERPREDFKTVGAWKTWARHYVGKEAGCERRSPSGYRNGILYKGKLHRRYRLVWLMFHDDVPDRIDHINRDSLDDRIDNLRPIDLTMNNANGRRMANNKSGHRGVSWNNGKKRWTASISCRGERMFLGRYKDKEEAIRVYVAASKKYFGEYAFLG